MSELATMSDAELKKIASQFEHRAPEPPCGQCDCDRCEARRILWGRKLWARRFGKVEPIPEMGANR